MAEHGQGDSGAIGGYLAADGAAALVEACDPGGILGAVHRAGLSGILGTW